MRLMTALLQIIVLIVIWLWFMISKNMEYFWKVLYACILKSVFTYMHIGNVVL